MPKHLNPASCNAYNTITLFRFHIVDNKCFILYRVVEH